MSPERIDLLERDVQSHAKTLSELTLALAGIKDDLSEIDKDKAVDEIKGTFLQKRLDGIEDRIAAVYKLGMWILAAFGAVFIAALANFVVNGGIAIAP